MSNEAESQTEIYKKNGKVINVELFYSTDNKTIKEIITDMLFNKQEV